MRIGKKVNRGPETSWVHLSGGQSPGRILCVCAEGAMSKSASSKNHEVQLAAFLIGRLAAEGVCIGAHKTLIFDVAIEAANELIRHQPNEVEMEERYALIAEQILEELRHKIDLAAKPGGPNIVSPNLGPEHLEELQSIVSAAEIDNVNAMTIANMRSLDVTAIEATCVLSRRHANVAGFSGEVRPGSPLPFQYRGIWQILGQQA